MARRPSAKPPAYRLHRPSGQAVVDLPDGLGGRHHVTLGKHGTAQSKTEYDRVIAEWLSAGRRWPPRAAEASGDGLSINELILAYWPHVEEYYRHPDSTPTSEANNIKLALRRLRALYGHTPAAAFDSLALDALRQHMIDERLARTRINRDIDRIKRLFRWGASKKLVPVDAWQSLLTLENLHAGRSAAKEMPKVMPVAEEVVLATLPFARPQVRAMALLQLHSGMRPGEVTIMRTMDLETSGERWVYRPGSEQGAAGKHKTAHRGHQRTIYLGPKAQEVLRPWLRLKLDEYLFQPRESRAAFDVERRARRKSKVPPSQAQRKPKANPRKTPGLRYTVAVYDRAIAKAVLAANAARLCERCKEASRDNAENWQPCDACLENQLPHWHPHQLRHTCATEIRRTEGLDAAKAVLGHRSTTITELYAEVDGTKAAEVMARHG
jgi:integrase